MVRELAAICTDAKYVRHAIPCTLDVFLVRPFRTSDWGRGVLQEAGDYLAQGGGNPIDRVKSRVRSLAAFQPRQGGLTDPSALLDLGEGQLLPLAFLLEQCK